MSLVDLSKINIEGAGESKPLWSIVVGDYRYVLYTNNKALVYKGESSTPTYTVDAVSCTCPGDKYSANKCKHRKAIQFLGDAEVEKAPPSKNSPADVSDILDI